MSLWSKLFGELVDVIEWTDDSSDTLVYQPSPDDANALTEPERSGLNRNAIQRHLYKDSPARLVSARNSAGAQTVKLRS